MESLQGMKNKAYANAVSSMFPEEGEMITLRGGLGNKIISQVKQENGVYYKRNNENEEWKEYNAHDQILKFVDSVLEDVKRNN